MEIAAHSWIDLSFSLKLAPRIPWHEGLQGVKSLLYPSDIFYFNLKIGRKKPGNYNSFRVFPCDIFFGCAKLRRRRELKARHASISTELLLSERLYPHLPEIRLHILLIRFISKANYGIHFASTRMQRTVQRLSPPLLQVKSVKSHGTSSLPSILSISSGHTVSLCTTE